MTLEPRKVEAEALKRWLKEAWGLVKREPISWVMLSLLFALLAPFLLLSFIFIPVTSLFTVGPACLAGVRIALRSDGRESHGPKVLVGKRTLIVALLTSLLIGLLFYFLLSFLEPELDLRGVPSNISISNWIILGFLALGWSFVLYHDINTRQNPDGIFGYLLFSHFGLKESERRQLIKKAFRVNREELFSLATRSGAVIMASSFIPFSTLFVLPLYCAIHYCAFRDIFLHEAQNAPAPVEAQQQAVTPSGIT